mgnify:CR=1 FL=1
MTGTEMAFDRTTLWLVIKHGLFAFGSVVALAVVWQRVMGTVEVGLGTAVVILGVFEKHGGHELGLPHGAGPGAFHL